MMDFDRCACGHKSIQQISYVRNDPANFVDPDGRFIWIPPEVYTVWTIVPTSPLMFGMSPLELFLFQQSQLEEAAAKANAAQAAAISSLYLSGMENAAAWAYLIANSNFSRECDEFLVSMGSSTAQLKAAAANVNILDATNSSFLMKDLFAGATNPIVPTKAAEDYGSMTVGYYVGHYAPQLLNKNIVALGQLNGNIVFINPSLWVGVQYETMMHELFHNITGYTDTDIEKAFGGTGITDLLRNGGCLPKS
jgi:hypothetical protein